MQNTQFLLWLRTLRAEDMQPFSRYLQQPQNAGKKLAGTFFEYLRLYQDAWRDQEQIVSPHLKEAAIHAHLYPGESIKTQRLRRLMMELRDMIEAFGASTVRTYIRPHLDTELRTLRYLLERNSPLFVQRLDTFSLQLEAEEFSEDLAWARMSLEQLRNEYLIHRLSPTDTFEQQLDGLDEYYLMLKLETWASMRTREYQYKQQHNYPFAEEIDRMASAIGKTKPMVALWRAIFAMVSIVDAPALFQAAVEALEVVKPRLQIMMLRQVRGYMFNALMRTRQTDNLPFFQRLHELLDTMLAEGTLHLPDGRISHPFFLSYVRAACLSANPSKASLFIQQHNDTQGVSHNLVSADPAGLIGYCNALTAYALGELLQSWKLLRTLKSHDPRTDAHIRMLHVQIAYVMDKEDDFFRLNDALRKFLARHPALGERFQSLVKKFTQFADSLARVRFAHNKASSNLLQRI
jgi:hypothetical protein